MFAPRTVFLDLETTGLSPRTDGITEIGAVIMEGAGAPVEWSRLVRPAVPIPPEIARMTGITNAMVADAPPFAALADELAALLDGALLVAHNARFDYAFLKQAFARESRAFFVPTLCTARLARELDPAIEHAGLDALAARYGLPEADRHRALGDARITHALAESLVASHNAEEVAQAVRRVLRRPSLPKHLAVDTLARLPEGPGVYLFHGLNAHPLYIGKAKSLRERVGGHFSGDWSSERGARLSEELRRIEVIETAGELSALLLESRLVRDRMPSHNVLLRRRDEAVVLRLDHDLRSWRTLPAANIAVEEQAGSFGPFGSRRQVRATLAVLAGEAGLCLKVLGLERRRREEAPDTPCFAYQVRRCAGACCGRESLEAHWTRLVDALAPLALPIWPHDGAVELAETDPDTGRSAHFTVRDWRLVDEGGTMAPFDHQTFRILRPYVEGRKRNPRVTLTRMGA
jgi:DNA polymerase-3 subunit epsilon